MTPFHAYQNVFRSLQVGPLIVKNRIQFSPVVSAHAHPFTGEVNADLIEFVGAQARSGAGLSGTEGALQLAAEGKRVALIDRLPQDELCLDAFELIRIQLMNLLRDSEVTTLYEVNVRRFTDTGVEVVTKEGRPRLLEADTIVTAFGLTRNTEIIEELSGVIPETYLVGDCNEVSTIATANTSAFNAVVEL
jgi:pyruvate/2-oxoglutarate dehydrogenase complex dihydrolipoamide dehydrogenase (E3) component